MVLALVTLIVYFGPPPLTPMLLAGRLLAAARALQQLIGPPLHHAYAPQLQRLPQHVWMTVEHRHTSQPLAPSEEPGRKENTEERVREPPPPFSVLLFEICWRDYSGVPTHFLHLCGEIGKLLEIA
jgi:hypothetical protein